MNPTILPLARATSGMTDAADLVVTNGAVHPRATPEDVAEAVAVRDGRIVRVGRADDVVHLVGIETEVVDCGGRPVLPGFVDAHTHLEQLGQHLVHADLSRADDREECLELLADHAASDPDREWVLGFGYDESTWADPVGGDGPTAGYLTRDDLDAVSETRPVAALRVDLHAISLNSRALERLADDLPDRDLHFEGGKPTGVAVEDAAAVVRRAISPGPDGMSEVLAAATRHAVERGVTCVHDKVRGSVAPRVYRDLAADGDLPLRVRIDYWSDHLEALREVGLGTDHGDAFVQAGAIKSFSDGSIGSRTAKLSEPYADAGGEGDGGHAGDVVSDDVGDGMSDDVAGVEVDAEDEADRGQWAVDPEALAALVERADDAGYQVCVHAIGDEAIEETLSVLESTPAPAEARHRIEHVELASDDHLRRMAQAGIVASMQPNFHRWADEGGLYDRRLGPSRRRRTNRFRRVLEAGVPLAFGSDCMPLDPLLGIHHAVNAPSAAQRLSVTEALRAYTAGGAYAGFDEDRLGTIEAGKRADLVVLEDSPWDRSDRIDDIDVAATAVDGRVVYDAR